jgi:Predicted integral membrane protein
MNASQYKVSLLVCLILLATVLGILALYSHTIMPGLRRTNDSTFVNSFQAIDRQIINPIFMLQFFAPLFILGLASFYAYKHHLVEAKYIYVALGCYLLAVLITMAVNVPLNDGIKKVTDTTNTESLASARTQFNESKWLLFNHLRTLFTLLATGFTSVAIWTSKLFS